MIGPGKYDDWCELLRLAFKADGLVLIVIGGYKGTGASTQTGDKRLFPVMASALRKMADEMERDAEKLKETEL